MIDEKKLIGEAFKSYRFKPLYTPPNKKDEVYEISKEVFENFEMMKEKHPELYNEFLQTMAKYAGKAAGATANAIGAAKDYLVGAGREAVAGYKSQREKRLGSKAPAQGEPQGNTDTKGEIQNLPPSQAQAQKTNDATKTLGYKKALNTINQKAFQNPGAVKSMMASPEFNDAFQKMANSPIFKGKNPQILKAAIASYLVVAGGNINKFGDRKQMTTANREADRNRLIGNGGD
jgi:hypothetical protein